MQALDADILWEYTVRVTDVAYRWSLLGNSTGIAVTVRTALKSSKISGAYRALPRKTSTAASARPRQLPTVDRWATLLRYICQRFAPAITSPGPQTALAGSG